MRRGSSPRRPYPIRRGGPRGGISRTPVPKRGRVFIDFSDSQTDSDTSDDDIKVVEVKKTSDSKPLLFSDSEEEDTYSNSPPYIKPKPTTKKNEQDWNSKSIRPVKPSQAPDRNSSNPRRHTLQSKGENFDLFNDINNKSLNENSEKPNNVSMNNNLMVYTNENEIGIHENSQRKSDKIISDGENEDNFIIPSNEYKNDKNNTQTNENNIRNRVDWDFSTIDANPFHVFTVVRNKKKFSKQKLRLLENNIEKYQSIDKKRGKKIIHLIYNESSVDPSIPKFAGFVRSCKKDSLFTFYSTKLKDDRDNREGELFGLCFSKDSNNQQSVDVVIPMFGDPHYPITQRVSLGQMAKSGILEFPNNSKFIKLISKEIGEGIGQEFGSSFYQDSIKNVVLIEPTTNNVVFILLRSNKEIFNMKVRPPLTDVQGYALAISMIKHKI
ncbi:hypothetical protein TRFO_35852 [Tritrichomonas foetus]|uniref:Tubby C-terminal domain-containing protein n=1 Tax=Tritrichomonas foetus TaxID=1144522 RepID=A0A1J4JFH5_9EUKA|nr:hypothetical protein TRFO_35852 [Tritrichomonas foetus]|eukprot:OHS97864.1 hypothetical protein TRFO_35852 [Tritrichomonas foetus]